MKRYLLIILIVGCLGVFTACGNNDGNNEKDGTSESSKPENTSIAGENEDDSKSEELFLTSYDEILKDLELLNAYSDYSGTVHSTIWDNVGVDEVATYIGYARAAKDNFSRYDVLLRMAFGDGDIWASVYEAEEYTKKYNESIEEIDKLIKKLDTSYSTLKKDYGSDYDISELKEYYLESVSYAEYATDIDGSYLSYNQSLNDYQKNISKLKKAAEMAY